MRSTIYLVLIIGLILSCNNKKETRQSIRRYYLCYKEWENHLDTIYLERDTSIFITTDTFSFRYNKQLIRIEKKVVNTEKLNLPPADFIAFYEKSIGIFYSKPIITSDSNNPYSSGFQILRTNNDSVNGYVAFLIGRILTYPKFCSDSVPKKFIQVKYLRK